VDSALASWSVLLAGVVSTLTLLALAALGLGWGGRFPVAFAVSLAALLVLGSVIAWHVLTHPAVLRRGLRLLLLLGGLMPWLCRAGPSAWAERAQNASLRLSARIALLRPTGVRWLVLITLAALSWIFDYLTLAASVAAVDSSVPWAVLLVGFLFVQGSIAVQIFPGGVGLAETSLLAVLLGSGVGAGAAAASVLIYRAITWLGLALLGWVVYALWIHTAPRTPPRGRARQMMRRRRSRARMGNYVIWRSDPAPDVEYGAGGRRKEDRSVSPPEAAPTVPGRC
jgi:uncharacterized membrane protein YbhN (UPF0104 family)